ncbi:unnamed protein product [Diplocarpon coronariae]
MNVVKDEKPDISVFLVNVNTYFTQMYNPGTYKRRYGYKNVMAYCVTHETRTPSPTVFDAAFGIPVIQHS